MAIQTRQSRVTPEQAGLRLDCLLPRLWPDLSRKLAQRVIRAGGCYVDGSRRRQPAGPVAAGQTVKVCLEPGRPFLQWVLPPGRVLHLDGGVAVLDKPSGLPVSPTPTGREGSLENALADFLADGQTPRPPSPAHRLDAPTSGVVAFARTAAAAAWLGTAFQSRTARKTYLALVDPGPAAGAGWIDVPLARADRSGNRWQAAPGGGQAARTGWRLIGHRPRAALLVIHPETGRTHQIRVHLAWQGWPIVGDTRYGGRPLEGLFGLHAWRLELPRSIGTPSSFTTPPPPTWAELFPGLADELAGWPVTAPPGGEGDETR